MLSLTIWRVKRRIRQIARRFCSRSKVFSIGATKLNPRYLAIFITTPTDADRDLMRASPDLVSEFRSALLAVGYPPSAVSEVSFNFESQETVDRDYNGNWWYATK
jgi:hypothetical protein